MTVDGRTASLVTPVDTDLGLSPILSGVVAMRTSTAVLIAALLDASDAELTGGSLCIDVPRLRAPDADTFAVDVPAGVAVTFVVGLVGAGTSTASDLDDRLRYDAALRSPGQIDTYTLEPEAGTELVLLDPVGADDCGVAWSVSDDGAEIFRGPSCFDTDPISVTTGGAVQIAVHAGSEPGPYSLEIVRVPEPRVEALRFGEPLDASIATPGARVGFTFAGTAGDELVLANPAGTNTNCQLVWRITGPDADDDDDEDADTVFQGPTCLNTDPIRLVATGPHVLEIDGNRGTTGAAAVTVFSVPQPRTEAVRFGETLEAAIEIPGQRVRFTFDGAAGDELSLSDPTGGNDNCQIVWRIIGPDGEGVVFEGPVCFEADPIVLETSGPHVLVVDGRLAATGSVSLTVGLRLPPRWSDDRHRAPRFPQSDR